MPARKFVLEPGGPPRIELQWRGIWKEMSVFFDDEHIGVIENQKALKEGAEFSLPDGTKLSVKLRTGFAGAELQVLRDGQPLPGSGSDPVQRLAAAWGVIFFIAGLSAAVGLVAFVFQVEFLLNLGVGLASVAFGGIFLVLGLFVKLKRSPVALGLALALFAIDGLFSFATAAALSGRPPVGMLIFRVLLMIPMFKGFAAIKALNQPTQPS